MGIKKWQVAQEMASAQPFPTGMSLPELYTLRSGAATF